MKNLVTALVVIGMITVGIMIYTLIPQSIDLSDLSSAETIVYTLN